MLADRRVDAGVNLDGSFRPALAQDLARPFLMVSAEDRAPGQRPDWDQTWTHLTGWRRWLHVPKLQHTSPSDAAVIVEWLGLPPQPLLDGPSPRYPRGPASVASRTCTDAEVVSRAAECPVG